MSVSRRGPPWLLLGCAWILGCSNGSSHAPPGEIDDVDAGDVHDAGRDGQDQDASPDAVDADVALDAEVVSDAGSGEGTVDAGNAEDSAVPDDDAGQDAGPPSPFFVEPYFSSAPGWNDYVIGNSDVSCAATETASCAHAGPRRKVVLPDETDCAGITAHDDLGWLQWSCSVENDDVVIRSDALMQGVQLRDMLDVANHRFKKNFVVVLRDLTEIAHTDPAPFWTTPVLTVAQNKTAGEDVLDQAGSIYVIKYKQIHDLRIAADSVALVATVNDVTSVASSRPVISAQGHGNLWLQNLDLDLSGHARGIELESNHDAIDDVTVHRDDIEAGSGADLIWKLTAGKVSKIKVQTPAYDGVHFELDSVDVAGLEVTNAQNDCMTMKLQHGDFTDLRCLSAVERGIFVEESEGDTFVGMRVSQTGSFGILFANIDRTSMTDIVVAQSSGTGFTLGDSLTSSDASQDVLVEGLVASNNHLDGIRLDGDNLRVSGVTAVSNHGDGMRVEGRNLLVMHSTLMHNTNEGLTVASGTTGGTFIDTVVGNNGGGVSIGLDASLDRFFDVYAAGGSKDLSSYGSNISFFGSIVLADTNDCVKGGNPNPGFATAPCKKAGASTATFGVGAVASAICIGSTLETDTANAQTGVVRLASSISNWVDFSHPMRVWSRPDAVDPADTRGPCDDTTMCKMRDMRTSSASSLANILGANPDQTLANAAHVITHEWYAPLQADCTALGSRATWTAGTSKCTSKLIDYATDGPFMASDDAICQGDEDCTVWRNHGAYFGDYASGLMSLGTGTGTTVPGFASSIRFWETQQ